MIPGSNLLNLAMTVITPQALTYYKALNRSVNSLGLWVTNYAPGVAITGSFQPVPKQLYQAYGLDLQRSYFTLYVSSGVQDVARNVTPDIVIYKNDRYQIESNNDWYKVDGWRGALCVLLNAGSTTPPFGFDVTPEESGNQNFENGGFQS